MEERRKFVRLDTRLDVAYTLLPTTEKQQTVTKDIGGGGVCFFTEKVLNRGDRLQVAMRLPDCDTPVNFTAEVVWCEPYEMIGKGSRTRAIEVGVRFIEIAPKDRDAVMQYVILGLKGRS